MEKGKESYMENVGQSESTPKFSLECSHPDASFESGACDNKWNYNLKSNVHSHNNHIISRHNPKCHSVLNHSIYKITLKQWLKKRKWKKKNNWDRDYLKWKVYRPEEKARKIIQGILHAVWELHSHERSHEFLYHLENFAIQNKELVIGGDHKKSKHVFLIHQNHELKDSSGVSENNNTQLGDRLAVSKVIFDQILGATTFKEYWYPQDLKKLRELLEKPKVSCHDWKLIVNHPSLWHWKSRFSYIERVQTHYVNSIPNSTPFNCMKSGFNKINVLGWTQNIPINSPLESVYYFKRKSYDGKKAEHLLRYLRNVRAHYKERMDKARPYDLNGRMDKARLYDLKFSNPQFIELKMTEVSELFLLNLYSMMCENEIEV